MDRRLAMTKEVVKYLFRRAKGSYFDANGVPIHYTVEGTGDPVVLIHGYGADADNNWRIPGVVQALSKNHQVITFDVRGHGLSGKPHTLEAYGIELVNDVIRLLDHLKINKAHVVGYSMGGFITLKLITMFPERLLSAVVCAAGWEHPTSEKLALIMSVADSLDAGTGFWPLLMNLNPPGQKPNRLVMAITNRFMLHMNDIVALALIMRKFDALAVTEDELRRNAVPVLTLAGSIDPLRSGVDNMTGLLANHQAVFINGGDHVTAISYPLYIEALAAFLANPVSEAPPAPAYECA